jgi:hypothetical protein
VVRDEGIGHCSFSAENGCDPASRRRAPAFDSLRSHMKTPRERGIFIWCGMRESNPRPEFGKLLFYH